MESSTLGKTIDKYAYATIYLSGGVFTAYNAAWLVDRGFSVADVSLIQSISLLFNFTIPPIILSFLQGTRCNIAIIVLCVITAIAYLIQELTNDLWGIICFVAIAYFMWSLIIPINEIGASNSSNGSGSEYAKYRITSALATFIGGLFLAAYIFFDVKLAYILSLLTCYIFVVLVNYYRSSAGTISVKVSKERKRFPFYLLLKKETVIAILPCSILIGVNYILYIHFTILINQKFEGRTFEPAAWLWNISFLSEIITFYVIYRYYHIYKSKKILVLSSAVSMIMLFLLYLALISNHGLSLLLSGIGMILFGITYGATAVYIFTIISGFCNKRVISHGFTVFYALSSGFIPIMIYIATYFTPILHYSHMILGGAIIIGIMFAVFLWVDELSLSASDKDRNI